MDTLDEQLEDALQSGRELGLHTLKACCQDKYRADVEPAITRMVTAGSVIEVKKHRYKKAGNGEP